jgi:outer membrane protein TolC
MRSRTSRIAASALAALLVAGPAAAQAQSVTLGEAIARANRVQPTVVQAEGNLRNADMRVKTAKGSFLPNLSASGSAGSAYNENVRVNTGSGDVQPPGTTNSLNTRISTDLELWDGFRRSNDLKAAHAGSDAAEAGLRNASFQQALTTTNQFFDALSARKLVDVRQASLRRAEEQHKISVAKLQAGAATRSDSLRSFVGVGTAQLQLVTAMSTLATAEANLGRLVGEGGRVEAADDSSFYRVIATLDTAALRTEAMATSPSVQSAEASVRAADASYKAAKSPYWPSLTLSASGSLNGNNSYNDQRQERNPYVMMSSRQITLSANWQLFNRFSREQNIETQAVAADVAKASFGEARRTVQANLTQRTVELEAARLRIEITQRSLEAAREDLRVQQERYRLGVSTILDVLTTTEALTQAEVDQVNSRFDYLRAKAAIEAIIGRSL